VGRGVGGVDEVGHGLGLTEVETATEEGLAGELAGFGHGSPTVEEGLKQCLLDIERAVAGELDGVETGVGMGSWEEGDDDFVEEGIADAEGGQTMGAAIGRKGYVARGNAEGVGAGEPDDRYASDA